MFKALAEFKKKHGHCDVPTHWGRSGNLASWVANQRHRKKLGILVSERSRKLESLGFTWAIYRTTKDQIAPNRPERVRRGAPAPVPRPKAASEERLYNVGGGQYVQCPGRSERKPEKLLRYISTHGGQLPPYIPVPRRPTEFDLGDGTSHKPRKAVWPGKGKLPKDVLEYVSENGVLPPHS